MLHYKFSNVGDRQVVVLNIATSEYLHGWSYSKDYEFYYINYKECQFGGELNANYNHSANYFRSLDRDRQTGADPGFFLGGGTLVSCSTSTPINHIVFFFAEYQLY